MYRMFLIQYIKNNTFIQGLQQYFYKSLYHLMRGRGKVEGSYAGQHSLKDSSYASSSNPSYRIVKNS